MNYIAKTNSTNSLLCETPYISGELEGIYTFHQTAGRGQAGNTWESKEGQNLLFSLRLKPNLHPSQLFQLTQWVSVVLVEVISSILKKDTQLTIKWPNDIYYGEKKLCGILIETAFAGSRIDYSVIGVGLNVNQTQFSEKIPNPISLKQITGETYDLHALMQDIYDAFMAKQDLLYNPEQLQAAYLSHLFRCEGWHPYLRREVSTLPTQPAFLPTTESYSYDMFLARFVAVHPDGCLELEHKNGAHETFHFKEIRYVLAH